MSNLIRGAVVAGMLVAIAAGCRPSTGLNLPCNLVRRLPDGGTGFITEREVQEKKGTTKDFVSFGAVECDDLVCVRDATFPNSTNLDGPAGGYCSAACSPGSACLSEKPEMDDDATTKLNCRPLLLDEATLGELCTTDPSACIDIGGVRSPYFCARGENPDAGT